MELSNLLALEQRTRSHSARTSVHACDGVCDGASSAILHAETNVRADWKTPYVRIGVQAVASWASLLCVYIVFDGFQDFMLSIFLCP